MRIESALAAFMLAAVSPAAGQDQPAVRLDWLVGDWRTEVVGQWTTEHWQPAKDGVMRGSGASGHDQVVTERESMTIARKDGKAVFTAELPGQPAVDFPELSHGPTEIVFANDAHDYPQRIRYWREGETLWAEISLKDGGKAMRWRYQRR